MGFQKRPKREPIKHFFPVPNEIFILGLSPGEIAVYCYLLRTEVRQTFQCYPSYEAIGKAVGVSKNTVAKYVRGLEEKRLIRTQPTKVLSRDGKPSTAISSSPSVPSRLLSRPFMSGS